MKDFWENAFLLIVSLLLVASIMYNVVQDARCDSYMEIIEGQDRTIDSLNQFVEHHMEERH